MKISVFGASKTKEESADYEQALEFGRALAIAGHNVLTGGYGGTMAAVSRGAHEAGGRVIGVTCAEVEKSHSVKPNSWLTEEVKCASLMERLGYLIQSCDLAVALPGGIGTLVEIALAWNLSVIGVKNMPAMLLVSEGWKSTLNAFFAAQGQYVSERDRASLLFCPTIEQALLEINRLGLSTSSD